MKYILCYGDSNTWGCSPLAVERYDFPVRWPGILQGLLGPDCRVYENALNGRTTVFDDPIEEGRCGKIGFPVVLEGCSPLDLVIIMLGTNDCKRRFNLEPWDIGWGMDLLVQYVKRSNCGWKGACPRILVVSPPAMSSKWERTILGTVFGKESEVRRWQLPQIYAEIAKTQGVDFLDAAQYAKGAEDCVHLSPAAHKRLGEAIADKAAEMLGVKIAGA